MKSIVVAAILAVFVWLLFRFRKSEVARGEQVFEQAVSLEDSGKYEGACFHYAVAANESYRTESCREKIRELWSSHGPFNFSEQLQELRTEYCRDLSCGEGLHHLTVSDIHKWVKGKE